MTGSLRHVLLDTTVAVAALRRNAAILQRLAGVQTMVPATVLGELHHGAHRAALTSTELGNIQVLIANSIVLDVDRVTAEQYGAIKYQLQRQGTPIPDNDIWIAASALQHRLPVATRDAHFGNVLGLIVEPW